MQTCDQRRLLTRSGTTSGTRIEPDAVDRFVADDVVIEAGGQEISGKDNIKNWVKQFLDHVNDLHVDTIETFQNEDGTRVTSRWVLTGTNNGILGTEPNGKPVAMTGTAVWTVRRRKAAARLGRAGLLRALPLPAREVAANAVRVDSWWRRAQSSSPSPLHPAPRPNPWRTAPAT